MITNKEARPDCEKDSAPNRRIHTLHQEATDIVVPVGSSFCFFLSSSSMMTRGSDGTCASSSGLSPNKKEESFSSLSTPVASENCGQIHKESSVLWLLSFCSSISSKCPGTVSAETTTISLSSLPCNCALSRRFRSM